MLKLLRRGTGRLAAVSIVFLTIVACVYYSSYSNNVVVSPTPRGSAILKSATNASPAKPMAEALRRAATPMFCPEIVPAKTDVDTVQRFGTFDFQPTWMKSKEYWDGHFEDRYVKRKENWERMPLKVIIVPHSHNDPGWLKTFEGYFHTHTRNILNNMAEKLKIYPNMTFVWAEISYLSLWWESAHPTKRNFVRSLLDSGRLEVTTGGWVMADEATSHLFALVNQLTEGHQWVKNNLNIAPKTGWSIDPFGHGSTMPYLLQASGVDSGAVIQRIHYAWKQWLAEKQMGDFLWRQNWDASGHADMLVHNQPFDIYSIKHSCGPHPQVCLNFDFRKIPNEYTEYSIRAVPINDNNVKAKAELLLNQFGRTGSLFPHNVVLMPLGDDFRYDHAREWDQQYENYKKIFEYVNNNKNTYNAELVFGTPSDYFKEVRERMQRGFRTLRGDFFVYSDIFSEGRPAYWSGYYTTRPYWKILDRALESNLRSAEVLYTWALNRARQSGSNSTVKLLERDFEKMTRARRNLGLFQHHDAITGTSKAYVMNDYALKLFESLQDVVQIQGFSAQTLLAKEALREKAQDPRYLNSIPSTWLLPDVERESYDRLPRKIPITVSREKSKTLTVFNSLAQPIQDIVSVQVTTPHIQVLDSANNPVLIQINPVWNLTNNMEKPQPQGKEKVLEHELKMVDGVYELMFLADIPAMTLATYTVKYQEAHSTDARAVIYCADCAKSSSAVFEVKNIQPGDVQLENHRMKLLIDGRTGFLKAVTRKKSGVVTQCALQFAAYASAQFHSGAYLFMPDPHSKDPEHEALDEDSQQIVITSGPLATQLNVVYNKFLHHFVRIYHVHGTLGEGIYMENTVDFEAPPKNRETELFMRIVTDITNGDPPEFYSDLNGFQMQRRVKVERIGIEGNYFPITTMAYIEDTRRRLSLLVAHAQGAAAWQPGWLEVMLDRRTLYDDSRGMGEGVVDNKETQMRYWLLLEDSYAKTPEADPLSRPSLFAHHLSNSLIYPPNVYVSESNISPTSLSLFDAGIPCDVHIVNVRTLSDTAQFPSRNALLVAQRHGFACDIGVGVAACDSAPPVAPRDSQTASPLLQPGTGFRDLSVAEVHHVSLTGLHVHRRLPSLDKAEIVPMGLVAVNITFAT